MDQCWSHCCRMFFFACGIFNVCLGSLAVRLDSSARCRDGARAHTRMAIKTCMCTAILNRFESWLTAIYSLLFSYQQNVFHILFPTRSWTTEEITCAYIVLGPLVIVVHCAHWTLHHFCDNPSAGPAMHMPSPGHCSQDQQWRQREKSTWPLKRAASNKQWKHVGILCIPPAMVFVWVIHLMAGFASPASQNSWPTNRVNTRRSALWCPGTAMLWQSKKTGIHTGITGNFQTLPIV